MSISTCLSLHLCYICFPTSSSKLVPKTIALSVCSPALKIKCSAASRSAVNLLQMLVKTSEETFSLVMCQEEKKVSEELLNISTTQQQGVKLALGYICRAQMSAVAEK